MCMLFPIALSFFVKARSAEELSPEMRARAAALKELKSSIQDWRTFRALGYDYQPERVLAGHDVVGKLTGLQAHEPLARLSMYVTKEELVQICLDTATPPNAPPL